MIDVFRGWPLLQAQSANLNSSKACGYETHEESENVDKIVESVPIN